MPSLCDLVLSSPSIPQRLPTGYFEWVPSDKAMSLETRLVSDLGERPRWALFNAQENGARVVMSVLRRDYLTLAICYKQRLLECKSSALVAGGFDAVLAEENRRKIAMSFVRRKSIEVGGAFQEFMVPEEARSKKLPALMEHLCRCVHEGTNEIRETTTLTVFAEAGVFKVFANSRDTEESLCVTAQTWDALWMTLERALVDPSSSWRPMKAKSPAKPPKKG